MDAYLHWSISESDDYEDTVYIVTVISESIKSNVTSFVTTNTSTQLVLLCGQEYNISVAENNCAGTNAPAEIFIEWHS